jgi:hypothetical protein
VSRIAVGVANGLLVEWGHNLGGVSRPSPMQAYALELNGEPISVAVSAFTVSNNVAGYDRTEVVECARLCTAPGNAWATRVMLRLWREVCAPCWPYGPVLAAVSYSQNAHHSGNLYRFDGWTRVTEKAGTTKDGTQKWNRGEQNTKRPMGSKSLWIWRYERHQAADTAGGGEGEG